MRKISGIKNTNITNRKKKADATLKTLVAAALATCMVFGSGQNAQSAPSKTLSNSSFTWSTTAGSTNKSATHYDLSTTIKYYNPLTGAEVAAGTSGAVAVGNILNGSSATWYANYTKTSNTRTNNDGGSTISVNKNYLGQGYSGTTATILSRFGASIYNGGGNTITSVTGDFIYSYLRLDSTDSFIYGGAIANNGNMNSIKGDFVGNQLSFATYSLEGGGGAIANRYNGIIGSITGNFYGNLVANSGNNSLGGAIFNLSDATITTLNAKFYGNSTRATGSQGLTTYNAQGGAIYNKGTIGTITNGLFAGNYSRADNSNASYSKYAYGGAIYNTGKINSLSADFYENFATNAWNSTTQNAGGGRACGGAIYNEGGTITNLQGDFSKNYASSNGTANGGAIFNPGGTISNGSLNGATFYQNYAKSWGDGVGQGGAIVNSAGGKFGDLNTNFVENYATSASGTARGGVIYNCDSATVGNMTGSFISNYASGKDAIGGAINNSSSIGNIAGNFINNQATNSTFTSSAVYGGGAIYNQGTLGTISATFANNKTTNGYGGAIVNLGTVGNIINSSFINNTVSATGTTYGGAIYTTKDINIVANNGTSEFSGNKAISNGSTDNNAIYVASNSANLGLNATNSGHILFNDNIKGTTGYNINITGDGTGKVSLYNNITGADLSATNATVDLQDSTTNKTYSFQTITSDTTAKYNIDVDLAGKVADKLITSSASNGTVTLDNINFTSSATKDTIVQVLSTPSNSLQLALGSNITQVTDKLAGLGNTVYNTDNFDQAEGLTLATTSTTNDSIKYLVEADHDTLQLINTKDSAEARNFTFTDNNTYTVSKDLGTTTAGTLNINGIDGTQSEINLNGHSGFELANQTNLNLNNTKLTGNDTLISVSNSNANVNLNNVTLNGNIVSNDEYNLNISGTGTTTLSGTVDNANATLNNATLVITGDTFANANLNAQSGTLNLQDGNADVYEFNSLTSSADTKYNIDLDLSGNTPSYDSIIAGAGSSGTITVSTINFINNVVPSEEFVIKILDAQNDDIKLAIDSSISGEKYTIGQVSETSQDNILATVSWDEIFNAYIRYGTVKGSIKLETTDTTNDSIALKVSETIWGEKEITGTLGDTLALVNRLETNETRNFNFDAAANVYKVNENLGNTTSGTFNINGVRDGKTISAINANRFSLFELNENTTLNISNIAIKNANAKQGSVINITNTDAIANLKNTSIESNTSTINGGAFNNIGGTLNIENSNFIGNTVATGSNGKGGAIYSTGTVNIAATDNFSTIFLGNTVNDTNGTRSEAIYLENEGSLNLNATNKGTISFYDAINGAPDYKLTISGDETGNIVFNNKVTNANIVHNDANTYVNAITSLNNNNNSLTMNGGVLNIGNIGSEIVNFNSFAIHGGDINIANVNVDLINQSMGKITADTYNTSTGGSINILGMTLLNETNNKITAIHFADESFKNFVTSKVDKVYSQTSVYDVTYDTSNKYGQGGYFLFTHGGSNGSGSYNPAAITSPVASQVGAYTAQTIAYDYAFNHADTFMPLPAHQRLTIQNTNKYAIAEGGLRPYTTDLHSSGTWYRPYTSIETVNLSGGPNVDAILYGSLVGGDGELKRLRNGWSTVSSAYVGYNGANMHYSGTSTYQNGGLVGATQTFYKNNFFTALTASAGASVGEANTMFGHENFTMLSAGLASRSGYNFEFNDGKFIVQPNWLMSYTFVNTFDYHNASGASIKSDPLHAIQLKPSVRFIGNLGNGWQPYFNVGMVWNVMDQTQATANNINLPSMSIKPYVEYGVGIQKRWKDKFTGFLQAMVRNGGRTGVMFTAGFRWAIGKDPKPVEKVQSQPAERKVLKEKKIKPNYSEDL